MACGGGGEEETAPNEVSNLDSEHVRPWLQDKPSWTPPFVVLGFNNPMLKVRLEDFSQGRYVYRTC
jgi:hypothetical protein